MLTSLSDHFANERQTDLQHLVGYSDTSNHVHNADDADDDDDDDDDATTTVG